MKKILSLAGLSILLLSIFTGCKEPVFYNIMTDVPPEQATVSGNINSIVRYTSGGDEYLVTNDSKGLIYKKTSDDGHGKWNVYQNLPFELVKYDYFGSGWVGEKIIKVVADSSNIYLVTVSFVNDNDVGTNAPYKFNIWAGNVTLTETSGSWTKVANTDDKLSFYKDKDGIYHTVFNVFCTNDLSKSNRKAYFRSGEENKVFELNGSSFTTKSVTPVDSTGLIDSAVYFNGTYRFFNSIASVSTSKAMYWSEGSVLCWSKNGTTKEATVCDANTEISCLAATNDSILIGRGNFSSSSSYSSGGITKTSLASDGTPGTSLTEFSTNATSQLSSAYLIHTVLCADPSKDELDASLYASISFKGSGASTSVSYENIGLWSYYPYPIRGNWNRE